MQRTGAATVETGAAVMRVEMLLGAARHAAHMLRATMGSD